MPKAIVLMYHNIGRPPKGAQIPNLYVTPRMFRFQMWYLKKAGFKVLSIPDLLDAVENGDRSNMAAITFDDGFRDFYTYAFPVLQNFGYSSTVYVVSGLVGKSSVWDSKKEIITKPLMDWDLIREVSKHNVEIGCHTKSHPHLTELPREHLKDEIAESKKDLEEHLNRPVDQFCYPYGDVNDEVKDQVIDAGFRHAVSTKRGHVVQGYDPFAIRRIPIKLITNPVSFLYKIHTDAEKKKGGQ